MPLSYRIGLLFFPGLLAAAIPDCQAQSASGTDANTLRQGLVELQQSIESLRVRAATDRAVAKSLPDVEVYAKSVDWILRHNEFFKPDYVKQATAAIETGKRRATELAAGQASWTTQAGTTIRGYTSVVDGSVQPYAVTLPDGVDPRSGKRWWLQVNLHGRAAQMNEVNFIHRFDGKPAAEGQKFIQLDVFGRTNNAYRWAGETDVFEALTDVKRRFRIDEDRVTLRGFSMGGAGSWHLGLHHPDQWSSVGPGAGFVDFYKYQKQSEHRPPWQHRTLGIYDSIDYAINAFNVPFCAYGGELDAQLVASTSMVQTAERDGVEIKLLVGPGVGHKFHPESLKEANAFHERHARQGRPGFLKRKSIRFTTRTLKYNTCDWLTIDEMRRMYDPATVEADVEDDGTLVVSTQNVAAFRVAREVAEEIIIDGTSLPLHSAADSLLPDVYYTRAPDGWAVLNYDDSRVFADNPDLSKRHNLQGPIDDAFMEPFICVRGTGTPWSGVNARWSTWTLKRFGTEFDKWMRGRIPIVDDSDVTDEMIADKNLILFGDPGSNSVLAKVIDDLPVQWSRKNIQVAGTLYDPETHGLSMIYPNPLNRGRYVVINSGHTIHTKDFEASNAWLFPRLGDVAVQRVKENSDGSFAEETIFADLFNGNWQFERR